MTIPPRILRAIDENGTNYSDLFADIDTDTIENVDSYGVRKIDAMIPNDPHSPRANSDGPLGAIIVRWIQSRIDNPAEPFGWQHSYGWQYLDAADIHTITYVEEAGDELEFEFINIFGHVEQGRRGYRLRAIANALGLLLELDPH
ncbi:hypothetical protein DC31_05740 [Microbacterium sp. CH12i]|uniref:hypothetical protein n=1 Tax=Microbacterium sp. CH12i TaxID=1479651 RepID=UPI000461D189|nr:hypothetical protein [Microbacterium sp. CH12i]KDA04644.1 hypothetical protein DC31_05740 [Microbacterium sp. CH12i]